MATIVERKTFSCPYCWAKALMKRWSCGCIEADGRHKSLKCTGCDECFFSKQARVCGQPGLPKTHAPTDKEL